MMAPRPNVEDGGGDGNQPGMPAEHAILGLLALSVNGSGHGYDLARHFGSEASLGNVIRLEPGMVYHHLRKLERLGWVDALPLAATGKPARRVFALSVDGRAELERWLSEPVGHTREIRLEFLVKLYLALLLDPALAVRLIDEQREICARLVASLAGRMGADRKRPHDQTRETKFGQMVLDMRLEQTKAALAWLERVHHEAKVAVEDRGMRRTNRR